VRREFNLGDGDLFVSQEELNRTGWDVDSSSSSQRVYGIVAELPGELLVPEHSVGACYRHSSGRAGAASRPRLPPMPCDPVRMARKDSLVGQYLLAFTPVFKAAFAAHPDFVSRGRHRDCDRPSAGSVSVLPFLRRDSDPIGKLREGSFRLDSHTGGEPAPRFRAARCVARRGDGESSSTRDSGWPANPAVGAWRLLTMLATQPSAVSELGGMLTMSGSRRRDCVP